MYYTIYNNYFYKVSSSSVDLRAGAYAFLEGNYFEDSKLPRVRSEKDESYNLASIKSYNDYVDSKSEEPSSSYGKWQVVTSRTASVISNCQIKGVNYSNFDTNSTLFYYDANKKQSAVMVLTTAEEAKVAVRNVRRDEMDEAKTKLKNKEISEDEEKSLEDKIQKETDKYVAKIDEVAEKKEKEIMSV